MINSTTVANTIQPYFNKKLLEHAVQELVLFDYAQQESIAPGGGNTSITFFRPPQADLTATGAPVLLTEGTAPTNDRDLSYTPITVSLVQIGQKGRVTDIADTVGLVKFLTSMVGLMGEECALDADGRLRNMLCHASTGLNKRYAQGLTNFAGVAAATAANARMTPRDLLDGFTQLKINRAPKVSGRYVALMPPQVSRDLMNDAEFREVVRNGNADKIFKGEIGDYYGNKIVEHTNPFTEDETEGTLATSFSSGGTNTTGFIYSTIFTGKGAYGTVDMKKLGGSPMKPQIVIVDKPDKADPLGQYISVGWKAYWAGVVLNPAWGLTVRSKTQFV